MESFTANKTHFVTLGIKLLIYKPTTINLYASEAYGVMVGKSL